MRAALLLAATCAILLLGGCADDDEEPSPPVTYRWWRTEVTIPGDSIEDVVVERHPTTDTSPADIAVALVADDSVEVRIRAVDGRVFADSMSDVEPALAEAILESIRTTDNTPNVWPYADVDPPREIVRHGSIAYPAISPASGLIVFSEDSRLVVVHNGRTRMAFDLSSGQPVEYPTSLDPAAPSPPQHDIDALFRFVSATARIVNVPPVLE